MSAELLKALEEYGIDYLQDIMMDVWNRGKIPEGWRNEKVWSVKATEE